MYYPPTLFFGWKLCGRVFAHTLPWDCSLYWKWRQQGSDSFFTCRDGFEKWQFWHSSLDCQLRTIVDWEIFTSKIIIFVVYFRGSFHPQNFLNGWRLQYEREPGVADCNAVAVRSSCRSGIYLGSLYVRTETYLLIIAAQMFLFAC